MVDPTNNLQHALWRIYNRPNHPEPWTGGGNLPWNDPEFSRRMLREHLEQTHGAASRPDPERERQLGWLWQKLELSPGATLLDVTCGPGLYATALAQQGIRVTGIDFGPASIAHARDLAAQHGVEEQCHFIEADVREVDFGESEYDAALFIYGQLAVFPREEARQLLRKVVRALKPGGRLVVELLNQDRVDKKNSTWWYTDDTGIWGDAPFFSFGERFWYEDEQLSCERFYTLHLETGQLDEIILCDQTYAIEEVQSMMEEAGFSQVDIYPAWDELELKDAVEWIVYVAQK